MKFKKNLACGWLILWFTASLAGFSMSSEHQLEHALEPPSWSHPFGFDAYGRDLIQIVLHASLKSSAFSLAAVAVSILLALLMASLTAFSSKPVRYLFLRILESLLAFPSLLFALAYAAVFGPGWDTLNFALLIGILPAFTRLLYLRTQEVLLEEYALASVSMGARPFILFRNHLLPALVSLCNIKIPHLFAHALLAEATLSFLGVGAPIGNDTWGSLLSQGKDYLLENPQIALGTGIPLTFTVLALQFLGESAAHKKNF